MWLIWHGLSSDCGPVPGGYKYRDLALQVGGVSYETVKVTANCRSKFQTRPLVREGAPQHKDRKCPRVRNLVMGPNWPTNRRSQNNLKLKWLRLALSKGPNEVGISLPSPEDRNRSSFRNTVFSSYLEFRTIDKVQKHNNSELTEYVLTYTVTSCCLTRCRIWDSHSGGYNAVQEYIASIFRVEK
jgi:hypothetical protein